MKPGAWADIIVFLKTFLSIWGGFRPFFF